MTLTYDSRYNVAYIKFKTKPAQVETIQISDELVVDMSPDGTIYGIELLNANEQLKWDDSGKLHIVNEATGAHAEFAFDSK